MVEARHTRIARFLSEPCDLASLSVYRILFGSLLFVSMARFWSKGLIASAYLEPKLFFSHYGLSFLPAPGVYVYAVFAALLVCALGITLGVYTRSSAAMFCVLFSYVHFLDVTIYLNHYYLVSLLTGLLACAPAGKLWSLDAARSPQSARSHAPRWVLLLFRFQVGLVYFFAGFAKLKRDWLFAGEPLRTWLAANLDLPLIGPLLVLPYAALVFSWLGAAYDLSMPLLLSLRPTRPYAYVAVLTFHLLTGLLFQIGMFPYLMIVNSLLFFPADWPRRLLGRSTPVEVRSAVMSPHAKWLVPAYMLVQLLLPLRQWFYPGNVLWTEQGYRFAWNVMLIEKTGSTEFRVVERDSGRHKLVYPHTVLTQPQVKAMSTQPDLILQLAHRLAERERAAGHEVSVYADSFVVLNGRAPRRFIDPRVDLARVRDGWSAKEWILPGP